MTNSDYDYHGLLANTWDVWRDNTANWDDRFFYLDIIRQYGQPVLDVGCGTGRLLLDYLGEGIDIDGLDNSPEMLAICQAKANKMGLSPTLLLQSMETVELPRTYRTILAPSSALQLITDVKTIKNTLSRFFSYLQSGGAVVGSFSFGWQQGEPLDTGWELLFEKLRPEDGAIVRAWVREWHEPEHQLWHTERRFEVELNGKIIQTEHQRRSPEGRWYSQAQARQLFHDSGFTNIQVFHEFTHKHALENDKLFCVLGVRS
jgi:ubiquinone/menaquinone biosynthesis C-methylase UbiE